MAEAKTEFDPAALPGPDDVLSEGEELEEIPKLSIKQKLLTGLAVLVFFLIFSLVFLPVEPIVRYALEKTSRTVRIEFGALELNVFSPDVISDLRVTTPDGSFIGASQLRSSLSYTSLLSEHAKGQIAVPKLSLEAAGLELSASTVNLDLNLRHLFQASNRWEGLVTLSSAKVQLVALPPLLKGLGIDLDPATVKIQSVRLQARLEADGRLILDGSSLNSNLFNIRLKGSGRVRQSIVAPDLDAEICLTPDRELETTNKALFDFYVTLGGTAGGSLCPRMKGIPGNLRWEMPQAKGAGLQ